MTFQILNLEILPLTLEFDAIADTIKSFFSVGLLQDELGVTVDAPKSSFAFQNYKCRRPNPYQLLVFGRINECGVSGNAVKEIEIPTVKFDKKVPDLTQEQMLAISQLPSKMTNRCKALMRKIICFSSENENVDNMLAAWVKSTKPRRADWLSIFKKLERTSHPLYFELAKSSFVI
ncbi:pentatricopeptide repeat-containing protein [Striga asiatica]|uniref:Pentatricopeptide repeat-containing protein n=1 Tax=Striga asiatica TaxID=4170 RepID=A0A5A7QRJ6_STRAF|nr:pentatricopeptide repeat-containing protein [Striga asiatica]